MGEQLVSVKGVKDGLNFYFNTKTASFKDICEALEKLLLEKDGFFTYASYYLYPDEPFSEGEREIIDEILYKYNLKKGIEPLVKNAEKHIEDEEEGFHSVIAPPGGNSVLINKNLRSGQKLIVKGNAILLGDINTGAELVASGNIVVMGTARGILHAGAEGDKDAYILVYDFSCQQLRINGSVSAYFDDLNLEGPQKITFEEDKIVVRPYTLAIKKAVAFL